MATILIVDDDAAFRATLAETLEDLGHAVRQAASCEAGLRALAEGRIAAAIVDLRLPGDDGLAFLRAAPGIAPGVPCLMLTAYASGSNTIEAMRLGAFDHLTKPLGRDALAVALGRALKAATQAAHETPGTLAPDCDLQDEKMLSNSAEMRAIFKRIGLVADSDNSVLVLGETGTGKELVAQALHQNSARSTGPFVAVNCAAIPAELLESELFGHVKGAFSGATADRPGRFREADGGTLFLDEIGDMALPTQAKILRVLQEREVTPLGARHSQPVDLRVVAATHRDLEAEVAAHTFRADLWYRLQVITITLPPLRERAGDVALLAAHFLRGRAGGREKRLSEPALRALEAHDWPGNVRELRNTIQRAIALSEGDLIEIEHLGLGAVRQAGDSATLPASATDIDWDGTLESALAQVELAMLRRALDAAAGNRSEAARRLGLSRQQLYRKLAQYRLE
ncbi:DNA-binding transcriptional response regulator, NtrC family, contains REC, AAA-type ATPase, and a Fis-type DNA-binding domains [Duganella sp. CF517]|uniref:sigma-54-dependent transcriptional regulator n=1 Tax=Duganella sp. CF517 TaxID=1881038 RepID=UPI0008C05001|nr:sigma-54 dependent transcriptional regulator [Duganella sp. CF517]SEN33404.1 DNA-binding transcriptional response regulator, NtrC family, contains REC, AAA-type ATPase, and a Fis-type DNA-binding domains [Duganella sp. CF517]